MTKTNHQLAFMALSAAAIVAACAGMGPQMGTVVFHLTDAPSTDFQSATVWVSKVQLVGGAGGPITVADTPATYNLLSLQNGVTALLGSVTVPTGSYEQLRLIVDSAQVVFATGLHLANGDTIVSLRVPSGMQTGIKVNFGGSLRVTPGQTDIVVDFDVSQSFVLMGPPTAPLGVIFKPVIHATAQDVSGSIAGTSSPASAFGMIFAIQGVDTVGSAAADTSTGAYKIFFLAPGTYLVADTAAGFKKDTVTVTVGNGQAVTGVDFTLTH
jgi:hypothetical protein